MISKHHLHNGDQAWSFSAILQLCGDRLKQLHVSDVNTHSKHDPLSLESMLAFQRVAGLVRDDIPLIMESRAFNQKRRAQNYSALGRDRPIHLEDDERGTREATY